MTFRHDLALSIRVFWLEYPHFGPLFLLQAAPELFV